MQSPFRSAGLLGPARAFGKLLKAARLFVLRPLDSSSRPQAHSHQNQKDPQSKQNCSPRTDIYHTDDCPPLSSDPRRIPASPKQIEVYNPPRKSPNNSGSESYLKRPFWFRIDDLAKGILKPEFGPIPYAKNSEDNHTSSASSPAIAGGIRNVE